MLYKPLKFKTTKDIKVSNKIHEQVIGQDKSLNLIKKAAKQRRNVILIGEPGTGKCVGKKTTIPNNLGNLNAEYLYKKLSKGAIKTKKIEGTYLRPNKYIYLYSINKNGKITKSKIINAYKSLTKKKCLKITTNSGATITLSGDHPILTLEDGNYLFKNASNIKKGTNICLSRRLPLNNKKAIPFKKHNKNIISSNDLIQFKGSNGVKSLQLKTPKELNTELAYFLGLYTAEGSYSKGITFSNNNKNIKLKIKETATSQFNYPEEYIEIDRREIRFKKARTLLYILEKYFNQKGWDNEKRRILSKQAQQKRVPQLILNSNKNILYSFLSGYIDGDGHFNKEAFEATSASKNLIKDLKLAFLKLGILSRLNIKKKHATNAKLKIKRNYYSLTISGSESLKELNKNLKLNILTKKSQLQRLSSKKGNTNVDLIYGIGNILKEIKNNIRIDFKKYQISPQAFNRYIRNKQSPSRNYIKKIKYNLQRDIQILKSKKTILQSHINYLNNLKLGMDNFTSRIRETPTQTSRKMLLRYINSQSQPSLNTVCKLYNISNKATQIYQDIKETSFIINTNPSVKLTYKNPLMSTTTKLIESHSSIITELSNKIKKLNKVNSKLSLLANSDVFLDKIKKIENVEEYTYDFEVENTHNFITGESIIVHNSLIGQALAELTPPEKLKDILAFHNPTDENTPLIRAVPKGQGRELVTRAKLQAASSLKNQNIVLFILLIIAMVAPWLIRKQYGDIMAAASLIGSMIFLGSFILFTSLSRRVNLLGSTSGNQVPKLLIDNSGKTKSPFIEATGAHAGALLGDVLHDPLQSGGLGTPPYERLIPGMIHRANGGVLFIDEIATLSPRSQQELLTAMQEKKYPITGQSERSSGAMTRSEPVPTDFILVAAGNPQTIQHMHPALRSRIRGYGYEAYMNHDMDDTPENQDKIAIFIAQEVVKDKKIPHFNKEAVEEIIQEARKRAGTKGKLTLHLRELGGLVRAAGDLALEQSSSIVKREHVLQAKSLARTLEQQIADKYIESKKKYEVIVIQGNLVGRVNGLAVIGSGTAFSGIVLPIESEITPGGKKAEIIATGQLGKIAKEAIKNVSAIVLKHFGEDIKEKYDIFVQFVQPGSESVEGDSASIAVATAIISALKTTPVRQDTAMTGSLSIRGEVLAVGGVTAKIEAALDAGLKRVIIPKTNEQDVFLSKENKNKIQIIPVSTIQEVLKEALVWKGRENILKKLK